MTEHRLIHVVDDEESVRRSLGFLLKAAGFRVEKWQDGEAFLKGVDKSVPACAVLDVRMPGMDGLQVQAEMAARGFNFPVIVLTGHGDVSTAVRAMQGGAVDFLEKPFNRDRLLQALEIGFSQMSDLQGQLERKQWADKQVAVLTDREREVLHGLACGLPNKAIAYDLGITSRTIEVHRANLMTKLEVSSFADALRIAFAAGFGSKQEWQRDHVAGGRLPRRGA